MVFRQTSLLDLRFELERVWKIATRKQMGKTIDDAGRKIERLANLASRAAAALSSPPRVCRSDDKFPGSLLRADRRWEDPDRCQASLCGSHLGIVRTRDDFPLDQPG